MSWTAPRTWLVGDVLTAALFNAQFSANLTDLDARANTSTNAVTTADTVTSVTYAAPVATTGPTVTLTTGVAVDLYMRLELNNAGGSVFMGFAISGATTLAASDASALYVPTTASFFGLGEMLPVTGLTAGVNTFTAQYRVTAGTGNIKNRYLAVRPSVKLS